MANDDFPSLAGLVQGEGSDTAEWRPPKSLWERATAPIKAGFALSRNLPAQLVRLTAPEAYRAAAEEQARALQITPESSVFEQAQALPGVGDIAAQVIPEDSAWRAPVQFAGNLVDPLVALPLLRATKLAGPAILGAEGAVARMGAALGRGLAGEAGAGIGAKAAQLATTAPFSAAAGLVYAPELYQGITQGAQRTVKALQQGDIGETTSAAFATATQAALALGVGYGAAHEARAARAAFGAARPGVRPPEPIRPPVEAPAVPPAAPGAFPEPGQIPLDFGAGAGAGVPPPVPPQATREGVVAAQQGAPVPTPTTTERVAAATSAETGTPGFTGKMPEPPAAAAPAVPPPQPPPGFPPAGAAAAPPVPLAPGAWVQPPFDAMYAQAVAAVRSGQIPVSTGAIQRLVRTGFSNAGKMIDRMEAEGIISPPSAKGVRTILQPAAPPAPAPGGFPPSAAAELTPAQAFGVEGVQPQAFNVPMPHELAFQQVNPQTGILEEIQPRGGKPAAGPAALGRGLTDDPPIFRVDPKTGEVTYLKPDPTGPRTVNKEGISVPRMVPMTDAEVEAYRAARRAGAPTPVAEVAAEAPKAGGEFVSGDAVTHPRYGEGVVTEATADNVTVKFGKKEVDLAPRDLTRLEPAAGAPPAAPVPTPAPVEAAISPAAGGEPTPPAIVAPAGAVAAERPAPAVPRDETLVEPTLPRGGVGASPVERSIYTDYDAQGNPIQRVVETPPVKPEYGNVSPPAGTGRAGTRQPYEVPEGMPPGATATPFTEAVPPELKAKPEPGGTIPPIPADLTPEQIKLVEDNLPALRRRAARLARLYPGKVAEAENAAWNAFYKSAQSFEEGRVGKPGTAGEGKTKSFVSWATGNARRDIGRLNEGALNLENRGAGLEGAELAHPKAGAQRTSVPTPEEELLTKGARSIDPVIEQNVDKSYVRDEEFVRRANAATDALDSLDEKTQGAWTAATSGTTSAEFAKQAGITPSEAQKAYRALGTQARAIWDAHGIDVRSGESFKAGEIWIPESSANELGKKAAAWAPLPSDNLAMFDGMKDKAPDVRWSMLDADQKLQVKRGLQRMAFGIKGPQDAGAIQAWVNDLEATGSLPAVNLGKKASARTQAEAFVTQVFGQKPEEWFGPRAQREFSDWINSLERAEKGALSPAWKPSMSKGLMSASTEAGPMWARIHNLPGGVHAFEPSAKLWGNAASVSEESAQGVLDRLASLIKKKDIATGEFIVVPDALKKRASEAGKLWDDFRNRYLQPQDQGRIAEGTLYRVRDLGGGPPRLPFAQADFLGLQTLSDLAARGLKEAPRIMDQAAAFVAAGARSFGEWSGKMLSTFGESVRKWLSEIWVRITDAMEGWAEKRSQTMKSLLTEAFGTEPARFGPKRVLDQADTLRAVQSVADTAESLRLAGQDSRARTAELPQERFLRGKHAQAIEEELAMILSSEAPPIDVGKVRPGSPEGELYDLGINLARVGEHVPERVKRSQAYLQRAIEILADRRTPVRTSEVVRQSLPYMSLSPGEMLAQVQKKLGQSLTYGEAFTIRNLRDILSKDYVASQDAAVTASARFKAGEISQEAYEAALRDGAAAQARVAAVMLTATNVGSYGGRLMRFQREMTSDVPFASFRNRFINAAREGFQIKQAAAEELYGAYKDLADGKISLSDYMLKLHAAANPSLADKVIQVLRASFLTPLSPIGAGASNAIGVRLQRASSRLAGMLSPTMRKLAGGMDKTLAEALGPEQANYAMPHTLRAQAASEASRENMTMLRDAGPRILKLQAFDPRTYGEGLVEGLHPGGSAIPGKLGEFVNAMMKTLEVGDRWAQNQVIADGIYQHGWNEAVKAAKAAGQTLDEASLVSDTMRRVNTMREIAQEGPDFLYQKYGTEQARALLSQYSDPLTRIQQEAQRVTMANSLREMDQPYLRGFAQAGEAIGKATRGSVLGTLFFPFTRTPTNSVIMALMHSPLGFWEVNKALKAGRITPAQWERDIMRPLMGSTLMLGMVPLAFDGTITGGGPTDPKREQLLRATGWQPYSVRIGDQYFSYTRLEPLRALAGFIGDLGDSLRSGELQDEQGQVKVGKIFQHAADSISQNLTNQTFLSGMENLMSAVSNPDKYGERFVKQLTGSLVPNTLGYIPIGSLGRAVDPYVRQTSIWTAPLAKIPFLNEQLPAQVSPTGEMIQKPGSAPERLLSPFQRSEAKTTPAAAVAREMDRLDYTPSRAPAFQSINGRKIYYTQAELSQLDKAQAQATTDLYRMIRSQSYLSAPDSDVGKPEGTVSKREMIERFYRGQRSSVQNKLRPQIEQRLRQRQYGTAAR